MSSIEIGLFCVCTRSLFGHASTLKVKGPVFCVYTRSLLDAMPGVNSANAEADAKQSVTKVGVDNREYWYDIRGEPYLSL